MVYADAEEVNHVAGGLIAVVSSASRLRPLEPKQCLFLGVFHTRAEILVTSEQESLRGWLLPPATSHRPIRLLLFLVLWEFRVIYREMCVLKDSSQHLSATIFLTIFSLTL